MIAASTSSGAAARQGSTRPLALPGIFATVLPCGGRLTGRAMRVLLSVRHILIGAVPRGAGDGRAVEQEDAPHSACSCSRPGRRGQGGPPAVLTPTISGGAS